jgi:transposase
MTWPWKAESLPDVRRLAVERVAAGESVSEVADSLGVTCRSVQRWVRLCEVWGPDALLPKAKPGRPPKLNHAIARQLLAWVKRSPCDFGFPTERWTAPRLAAVLREREGVSVNHRYLNDWLARHGVTPQTPPRHALERDEDRIAHWIRYEWPRIKKRRAIFTQPSVLPMNPDSCWPRSFAPPWPRLARRHI